MNSSIVSIYDNVTITEDLSESTIYQTINDLITINDDTKGKVFCPLCVFSFEAKFMLFEHLKSFHHSFLSKPSNHRLRFRECPICGSKFYGKHLTAKHTLLQHSNDIKELFVDSSSRCLFCEERFSKNDCKTLVKHVEENHFLDYVEEFKDKFSCGDLVHLTLSELISSFAGNETSLSESVTWEDLCVNFVSKNAGEKLLCKSKSKDFDSASKINCYDFTDLKNQLQRIKDSKELNTTSSSMKKSILKDIKNNTQEKSVRRVLQFDVPDKKNEKTDENKENSVIKQNLVSNKKVNIEEHSLLCHDNLDKIEKFLNESNVSWSKGTIHSSTPNQNIHKCKSKILVKDDKKRKKDLLQMNFKSYIYPKNLTEFEFQCGKCRKLFKENIDLVSHVKNNHKKFSLKVLQPCYRCAICHARFYKNYCLRKHHELHRPY